MSVLRRNSCRFRSTPRETSPEGSEKPRPRKRRWAVPPACVAFSACLLAACGGARSSLFEEPPGEGTVSLAFTVGGVADRAHCDAYGAREIQVLVFDWTTQPFTEVRAPCADFAVSLELPDGDYTGHAQLLGEKDEPVSKRVSLPELSVAAGTEVSVKLDFPVP